MNSEQKAETLTLMVMEEKYQSPVSNNMNYSLVDSSINDSNSINSSPESQKEKSFSNF